MKNKQEQDIELKYAELEKQLAAKSRDLEIEASLECVRSVAMGMNQSEDLMGICETMFHELKKLGFDDLRNAMISIHYDEQQYLLNYEYRESVGKTVIKVIYNSHPIVNSLVDHTKQSGEGFTEQVYTGEALDEWRAFRMGNGEADDPRLYNISALYYYFYSIGTGAVGISIFSAANPGQLEILKRFRNVFDLAYRRYTDIEKASVQAKEARIEASLERVRAVAMSMRQSDELISVCETLYKELLGLGFANIRNTQIAINNDERQTYSAFEYADYGTNVKEESYDTHKLLREIEIEVKRSKEALFQKKISGQELQDWKAWRKRIGLLTDERLEQAQAICFYLYSIGMGMLGISTYDAITADQLETLKRFKNVCELAYRRYADVAQAEAQAREAQIELALERVRAKTMAMQQSDELRDAASLMFQQIEALGISTFSCGYNIFQPGDGFCTSWMSNHGQLQPPFEIPLDGSEYFIRFNNSKNNKEDFWIEELAGDKIEAHYEYLFSVPGAQAISTLNKQNQIALPAHQVNHIVNFLQGNLLFITYGQVPEAHDIFKRFGKTFEQTYTRFLDLQRAEKQAKESQIELALERVRARTMAMQRSDELAETAYILFQQFRELGENPDQATIGIINEAEGVIEYWVTLYGNQANRVFKFPIDEPNVTRKIYDAWKGQEKSLVIDLSGQALYDFSKFRESMGGAGYNEAEQRRIINVAFFSKGLINVQSTVERSVESLRLLERFANVFEGTYTRFLDLKNAEAQAREAQIEAALECVRSRTMAMQKSDELREVIQLIYDQFVHLNFNISTANFSTEYRAGNDFNIWAASSNQRYPAMIFIPYFDHPIFNIPIAARNVSDHSIVSLTFSEKNQWWDHFFKNASPLPDFPRDILDRIYNAPGFYSYGVFMKTVSFNIINYEGYAYTEAEQAVVMRFGKVFEQTYTRFKDLKQAEEQAREAKIETALEKVRARALAMHQSQDINTAVLTVFEELEKLDLEILRCGIGIIDKENQIGDIWTTVNLDGKSSIQVSGKEPMNMHPLMQGTYDAWLNQTDFLYELAGDDLVAYYRAVAGTNFTLPESHSLTGENDGAKQYYYTPTFKTGNLYAFRESPFPDDAKLIMKRFASALNLTFSRFLDLQKAEAQAREAQIEASLERVRSKAMAMRNSGDLLAAASTVFTELHNLGISQIRSGVGLITKDFHNAKLYSATSSQSAVDLSLMGEVTLSGHPVFEQQYQSWLKQENYFVALEGEELASYYKILSAALNADLGVTIKKNQKEYGHWFMFSEGFLYAWSDKEYTDAEIKVLERFKNVMGLTIRRYIELQKSETQAREAIRQASLDRVRAEIASMRTISDLDRITPLIWNELTILGVPFIRCGVFIMDEPLQLIHTYLSTPDGKAIAAFQLHFNSETGTGVNGVALRGWREKKMVTLHWTEEEFRNFSRSLVHQGELATEDGYLTDAPPTTGLDLHFFPFLQGMLYAGNTTPLSDDDKDLVQSLADAFSTAYARYEDFNRLELAKQEVERTLTDLKAAQTRLIQSEKMASLGELTAGIAHEIQNPLNFVNNFSEVNQEMIDELEEELQAGNIEEALAIAADIKQNEQKINHHGKRADGIVKGMLQHSRTAGGEKLPTNINSVAEEYMRLSYHGLRAKDKAFNAEMVMHFDPDLPKIMAVGQDIGRVLLNLFNNAFYAVNQKQKTADKEYKPEVTVKTYVENDKVVIKVKDNGIGIPDAIKEKIMQPFFTTKPTGEGTGLGLSLTYDMVVKGHGGSIQVNSVEGEGSEFIVSLPL